MNAALFCLAFVGFEALCYYQAQARPVQRDQVVMDDGSAVRTVPDPTLGSVPRPGVGAKWRRTLGTEELFNVRYSIDRHGRRATPLPEVDARSCILFFGDSFTFGAGVNDSDTMPAKTAALAQTYRVLNLAYSGYGPHHMLAALQSNVLNQVDCLPRFVIFWAIPDHAIRVSRARPWDLDGPRYVLDGDSVKRAGQMKDGISTAERKIWPQLRKSYLLDRLLLEPYDRWITEARIALLSGVLSASRTIITSANPPAEFHVLLWDIGAAAETIAVSLEGAGIRVHRLSQVLPQLRDRPELHQLGPHEAHPNVAAHAQVAQYVHGQIVKSQAPKQP